MGNKLIIFISIIFITSCVPYIEQEPGRNISDTKNVAEGFLINYYHGDLESMSKFCTPQVQRRITSIFNNSDKFIDSSYTFNFKRDSVISENKIFVIYEWKGEHKIQLQKIENTWYVAD